MIAKASNNERCPYNENQTCSSVGYMHVCQTSSERLNGETQTIFVS